MTDKYTDFLL